MYRRAERAPFFGGQQHATSVTTPICYTPLSTNDALTSGLEPPVSEKSSQVPHMSSLFYAKAQWHSHLHL